MNWFVPGVESLWPRSSGKTWRGELRLNKNGAKDLKSEREERKRYNRITSDIQMRRQVDNRIY